MRGLNTVYISIYIGQNRFVFNEKSVRYIQISKSCVYIWLRLEKFNKLKISPV